MLKPVRIARMADFDIQPPSGGCVLKLITASCLAGFAGPAAFGRLCVETTKQLMLWLDRVPAAFGRLCVETTIQPLARRLKRPAAFGRLCVETDSTLMRSATVGWPAAFGRLCVETNGWKYERRVKYPAAFGRLCVETAMLPIF